MSTPSTTYNCTINNMAVTVPYNITPDLTANPVGINGFSIMPSEIRTTIWSYFKITDFNALFLTCKGVCKMLNEQDLEYLAKKHLQLFGIKDTPTLTELKKSLFRANKINTVYLERFSYLNTRLSGISMLHLQMKMNSHFTYGTQTPTICYFNNIDLNNPIVKQRFISAITPQLVNGMTSLAGGIFPDNFLYLPPKKSSLNSASNDLGFSYNRNFGKRSFDFNSLLNDSEIFEEYEKCNFNQKKLLEYFNYVFSPKNQSYHDFFIASLLTILAIKSVLNGTTNEVHQLDHEQIKIIEEKLTDIENLIPFKKDKSKLRQLLELAPDFRTAVVSAPLELLRKNGIIDFQSIVETNNLDVLYNINNQTQYSLLHLLINLPQETKDLFKKNLDLIPLITKYQKRFSMLTRYNQFFIKDLLKLTKNNQKLFIQNSKILEKLCRNGNLSLRQVFIPLNIETFNKLLMNIEVFNELFDHWKLQRNLKNIDLFTLPPQMLNDMICHAVELTASKSGKKGYEEFYNKYTSNAAQIQKNSNTLRDHINTINTTSTIVTKSGTTEISDNESISSANSHFPEPYENLNEFLERTVEDNRENFIEEDQPILESDEDLEDGIEEVVNNLTFEEAEFAHDDIPIQGSRGLKRPQNDDINSKPAKIRSKEQSNNNAVQYSSDEDLDQKSKT